MSDYVHVKALRYKPTEEDIDRIYVEFLEWRKNNPIKCLWIKNKEDWQDYLECIKCLDLFKNISSYPRLQTNASDTEKYIDYVLYLDYGEESDEWYRARYTTSTEQDKYRNVFEQIFPNIDMNRVHYVDYCYYNSSEPCNCWDIEEDEFYKEV